MSISLGVCLLRFSTMTLRCTMLSRHLRICLPRDVFITSAKLWLREVHLFLYVLPTWPIFWKYNMPTLHDIVLIKEKNIEPTHNNNFIQTSYSNLWTCSARLNSTNSKRNDLRSIYHIRYIGRITAEWGWSTWTSIPVFEHVHVHWLHRGAWSWTLFETLVLFIVPRSRSLWSFSLTSLRPNWPRQSGHVTDPGKRVMWLTKTIGSCDWPRQSGHVTDQDNRVMWLTKTNGSCDWPRQSGHVTDRGNRVMWLTKTNGPCQWPRQMGHVTDQGKRSCH